jgi:hypothetical protein
MKKSRTGNDQDPLQRLPPRKAAFALARAKGGTIRAASKIAGISERSGARYAKDANVQALYTALIRQAMPAEEIAEKIWEGCHAMRPVWDASGRKMQDRADFRTRLPYLKMAAEHGKYAAPVTESTKATQFNITVRYIGSRQSAQTPALEVPVIKAQDGQVGDVKADDETRALPENLRNGNGSEN